MPACSDPFGAPPVDRDRLAGEAPEVAPALLHLLLRTGDAVGRIVEVEAYTSSDPASHSRRGPTARNRSMFQRAGTLYVYRIYGLHLCANVVTGPPGDGQAVLVRALVPAAGIDAMRRRRPGRTDRTLADGPGKLCAALGIELVHDGVDLCDAAAPVQLVDDGTPPPERSTVGPRIGISVARDVPWRWRAG